MDLKQALTSRSKEDIKSPGKTVPIPAGAKVIKGVRCPECGTFYSMASKIEKCNTDGCKYTVKKQMKRREMKAHLKKIRAEKAAKEVKKNGL